jgi:maleate cis-trans isomerase
MGIVPFAGATYGWRAAIGVILPGITSETNAYEFYLMAPPGVIMVHTALNVGGREQRHYDEALGRLEDAVKALVERHVDAIVQAGVPPIVTHGWGFEDEVLAQVAAITPVPAITDIGACIAGMRRLQMQRVVMLTGFNTDLYGDTMHNLLIDYVRHAGIEVVAADSVKTTPFREISRLPVAVTYRAAKALYRSAGPVDGIWITGAFMPSAGMIGQLEADVGAPVVSSMPALVWKGLRMAGIADQIAGFGRLLELDDRGG